MNIEELKKKKLQALKYLEKYNKLQKEIKENCHHPDGEVILKEKYYSGSFLNRAETEYWNECMICGACSERTIKQHSYYG